MFPENVFGARGFFRFVLLVVVVVLFLFFLLTAMWDPSCGYNDMAAHDALCWVEYLSVWEPTRDLWKDTATP